MASVFNLRPSSTTSNAAPESIVQRPTSVHNPQLYPMTDSQLLQEFEALAYRLNIPVSREDLMGGTGGLCVVRGEQRIILDYRLDVPTQVELLARAFSQLPLDDVFLKPSLRERIDLYGEAQV